MMIESQYSLSYKKESFLLSIQMGVFHILIPDK